MLVGSRLSDHAMVMDQRETARRTHRQLPRNNACRQSRHAGFVLDDAIDVDADRRSTL